MIIPINEVLLGLIMRALLFLSLVTCVTAYIQVDDRRGQRPICDSSINVTKGKNYRYATLNNCKNACAETPRCDAISRYGGKTDSSPWHCWFYACGERKIEWEPQTAWGNGANLATTYFRTDVGPHNNETRYVNVTRYINVTRYNNASGSISSSNALPTQIKADCSSLQTRDVVLIAALCLVFFGAFLREFCEMNINPSMVEDDIFSPDKEGVEI